MNSHADHEKQLTILAVDDTPDNLTLLLNHLRSQNYKVLVAESGISALEQVAQLRPHLILLDVLMPQLDGFETCKLLKTQPHIKDVPIIFLTALGDSVDKVRGFDAGGVDFISKPIDIAEVSARINTHLQLDGLKQRLAHQNKLLTETVAERDSALALQKRLRIQSESNLAQVVKMSEVQATQSHNTLHSLIHAQLNNDNVWHLLHLPLVQHLAKLQAQLTLLQSKVNSDKMLASDELVVHVANLLETTRVVESEVATFAPTQPSFKHEQTLLASLSDRERDVLTQMSDGYSSDEIANALSLSPATVRTYRTRIMNKLTINNVPSLVKFALRHGLSSLN